MYNAIPLNAKKVDLLCGPKNFIAQGEAIAAFLNEYRENHEAIAREISIELAFLRPVARLQKSGSILELIYRKTNVGTLFYTGTKRDGYTYCFQPERALAAADLTELTAYFRMQDLVLQREEQRLLIKPEPKKRGRPPKNRPEQNASVKLETPPAKRLTGEQIKKLEDALRAKGKIV
jgi:hypothetical protein